jgi:hypothetical protein
MVLAQIFSKVKILDRGSKKKHHIKSSVLTQKFSGFATKIL